MLVLTDDDAKTVQNVVHSLQVLETISPVITNNDIKEKVCIIAIYLNISPSFSPLPLNSCFHCCLFSFLV